MSVSFYACPVYGICVPADKIKTKMRNPVYNPEAPYDPRTGRKIDEYITESLDIDQIASDHGLKMCVSTDSEYLFIGIHGSNIDIGNQHFSKLPPIDIKDTDAKLEYICNKYGFDFNTLGYYTVGYCSY